MAAAALGGLSAAYLAVIRPWGLHWGATEEERRRPMKGDDFVQEPNYWTTKAITVEAEPSDLWPWLAQLGRGRGGLYSYDFLDRLFGILDAASATAILPQYQELRTGDLVPMKGRDWPVLYAEPDHVLVLGDHLDQQGSGWSWAFELHETAPGHTRLISRSRGQTPRGVTSAIGLVILDAAAFVMTRKMLLNLKERAERLHTVRSADIDRRLYASEAPSPRIGDPAPLPAQDRAR
jgi:hypothetical protein